MRSDWELLEAARARLQTLQSDLTKAGEPAAAAEVAIVALELSAIALQARGRVDEALRVAKEAADLETTTDAPNGPPLVIMKPALELYDEMLLEANRPADAVPVFEQSLLRTPKRTPSLIGAARSAARSGDATAARRHYTEILAMPGVDPNAPAVMEARGFAAQSGR